MMMVASMWYVTVFIHIVALPLALLVTGLLFLCLDALRDTWRYP